MDKADATESNGAHPTCGNCGKTAGPSYCSHCGQEVEPRHGPLWAVCRDFFSDWLSLDSQLLRSLRALLQPARLSQLYLSGKRAPYLRPFRLYLVASVVLFSTLLTFHVPDVSDYEISIGGRQIGTQESSPPTRSVEFQVGATKTGKVTRTLQFMDDDTALGRLLIGLAGDRLDRLHTLPAERVVETLFTGLRRLLPLALILFVPLLALGLKLLYIRRRADHSLYLDHLVFAVHFQTALFFTLSGAWIVGRVLRLEIGGNIVVMVAAVIAILFVYLPLAVRRFYGQSWFWTACKTLAVLYIYQQLLGTIVSAAALLAIWEA